jgi:hypothetical protein
LLTRAAGEVVKDVGGRMRTLGFDEPRRERGRTVAKQLARTAKR